MNIDEKIAFVQLTDAFAVHTSSESKQLVNDAT